MDRESVASGIRHGGTETLLMGLLKIHPVSLRFCLELSEAEREELKKR